MALLLDTSALYALLDRRDPNHARAAQAFAEAMRDAVMHAYVVVETTALLHRRLGHQAARDFLERVVAAYEVVWIDEDVHRAAVSAYVASRRVPFVDCVSFEVMRRRGITRAFAFDRDFVDAGFELFPA